MLDVTECRKCEAPAADPSTLDEGVCEECVSGQEYL